MKSINFSTGYKEYCFNNDKNNKVLININDINLISRIDKFADDLKQVTDGFDVNTATPHDFEEIDKKIKAELDNVLDTDISAHAFGKMNCLSIVDYDESDEPVFLLLRFLDAFLPVLMNDINKAYEGRKKASRKKAEKYIADSKEVETGSDNA